MIQMLSFPKRKPFLEPPWNLIHHDTVYDDIVGWERAPWKNQRVILKPTGTFFMSLLLHFYPHSGLGLCSVYKKLRIDTISEWLLTPLMQVIFPINFLFSSLSVLVLWKYTPVVLDPRCFLGLLNHVFLERRFWFSSSFDNMSRTKSKISLMLSNDHVCVSQVGMGAETQY